MYLWWWDWKKVGVVVGVIVAIGVLVLLSNPFANNTVVQTFASTVYQQQGPSYVNLVAELRVKGSMCIIRVPLPPVPNTSIRWPWRVANATRPNAGGYYAYMALYNGSHLAIAPIVARAFKNDIYIVSECEIRGDWVVFKRFPTFINRTSYGFNEQRASKVPFGECNSSYCEFGWRDWVYFPVPIREVYVFVNWYFNPVDGYNTAPIGGLPYRVAVYKS